MRSSAQALQEQDVPLSPEQLASRLREFEIYREKIAADIESLETRRLRLQEDLDEFSQLVENVDKLITDGTTTFESRVVIGSDVSVAARVPDAARIFVAVGLGFHVEVPLAEVGQLVEPRRKHLAIQLEEVERKLSDARACTLAFDSSLRLLKKGHTQGS